LEFQPAWAIDRLWHRMSDNGSEAPGPVCLVMVKPERSKGACAAFADEFVARRPAGHGTGDGGSVPVVSLTDGDLGMALEEAKAIMVVAPRGVSGRTLRRAHLELTLVGEDKTTALVLLG
jgi:hypothetical protein